MIRWLGLASLLLSAPALAQATNQKGERTFQRCYSCHSVARGDKGLSGPNLHRLGARSVAGDPEFDYSKAFKDFAASNPRWTPELLDRFLTDPDAVAPGNQMGFFGLKDASERAAIVAYILDGR